MPPADGRSAGVVSWFDELQDFLRADLARVQEHLNEVYEVNGALMQEVAEYVRELRGKLLRPAMVCLSARALGYRGDPAVYSRLGASIELFHVATLLHDDVIDKADERRGRATVNARWGDDVAILFADYLYASSFDLALSSLRPEVLRLLTRTTQAMTEGEMFQIERRGDWLSVQDYFEIIKKKTACLFSASTGLGAVIADAPADTISTMAEYGMEFGMAFQITDDALDYEAQEGRWGKRVGADVKEGKQTLPLLHALGAATERDRAVLVEALGNGRDFNLIHSYVRKYDGIGHSLAQAGRHAQRSQELLSGLPASEALRILHRVTRGVIEREF